MKPPKSGPEDLTDETSPGFDPELDKALKRVLQVIYREHPLGPNQILNLAAELQKQGVHRLVEEHLRKFRRQQVSED